MTPPPPPPFLPLPRRERTLDQIRLPIFEQIKPLVSADAWTPAPPTARGPSWGWPTIIQETKALSLKTFHLPDDAFARVWNGQADRECAAAVLLSLQRPGVPELPDASIYLQQVHRAATAPKEPYCPFEIGDLISNIDSALERLASAAESQCAIDVTQLPSPQLLASIAYAQVAEALSSRTDGETVTEANIIHIANVLAEQKLRLRQRRWLRAQHILGQYGAATAIIIIVSLPDSLFYQYPTYLQYNSYDAVLSIMLQGEINHPGFMLTYLHFLPKYLEWDLEHNYEDPHDKYGYHDDSFDY